MRWDGQTIAGDDGALPGMERARLAGLVRTLETPEFAGMRFHEVLARTALNHVPGSSRRMPLAWTINPYRGCSHACFLLLRPAHPPLSRSRHGHRLRPGDRREGQRRRGAAA